MKLRNLFPMTLMAAVLAVGAAGCMSDKADLAATAKITKAQAEEIALAKVPGGTIKEAELEKEKGRVIWSFDIATPGTKDITEVNVDAVSGEIAGIDKESPKDEADEKKKERD